MKQLILFLFIISLLFSSCYKNDNKLVTISDSIAQAEKLFDLQFSQVERDSMRADLNENLLAYQAIHSVKIDNSVSPALLFEPLPEGFEPRDRGNTGLIWTANSQVELPINKEDLAFYTVSQLASLIKNRKITSTDLTQFYLNRLKKYGDTLKCVITITDSLAMAQARIADTEIAAGKYRGPLHGIPYGLKDLLAVKEYKTTWGSVPYQNQVIDENSTVYLKLQEAGAVLVAKLTLGELAWGDVWFSGMTKNPWNLQEGSSGSSAGSASATAAGLVAFSIGTETWGSIVSPSTRCGVTGLRPTFGRVSRFGAMALSWSMDKIGPICRTAEDCALVFSAILGPDGKDKTVKEFPFNFPAPKELNQFKVGYIKNLFDADYDAHENDLAVLKAFKNAGIKVSEVKLPDNLPVESLHFILSAEAATAFDELTRSNRDTLLVRQIRNAWPNVFRAARLIPAVEYIQANRLRTMIIDQLHETFKNYDVIISPSFGGNQLLLTNLTGHPCVVVPNGFNKKGSPTSITFLGNFYDEATLLQFAKTYQDMTDFDEKHPPHFK